MDYKVEEVHDEKGKNIVIRLTGPDISFIATAYGVSIYLDEKTADSIAFLIQSLIQDRSRRYIEKTLDKS